MKNRKVLIGLGILVLVLILGIATFAKSGDFFKGSLNTAGGAPGINTASNSSGGTLNVASAWNPVLDDKVASPNSSTNTTSNPLLVARYRIYATGESFLVEKLTFAQDNAYLTGVVMAVILKYPTSMSAPTTLDGIATGVLGGNGVVVFNGLNVAVPASIVDENSINVEVYVATAGIGSGANSGDQIEMDLNGEYRGVGQTSGGVAVGNGLMDAPQIAVYKTLPTFSKHTSSTAPCPTTTLVSSSESPVYCLAITAHTGGAVGLRKLTFDVTPVHLNVTTAAGGLRASNGFKLYQYDASGNVNVTAVGQGTWSPNSNKAYINMVPEFTVPAGGTSYLVLKAPITFESSPAPSLIVTRLSVEPPAYNTAHQPSTSVAQASPNRFNIWSDRSAASHSFNSADWTHSYKLDQIPTQILQLTE